MGVIREGTELFVAPNAKNHHAIEPPPPPGTIFQPLYVSHLGKGRIVCFQWASQQPTLTAMTNGRFYPRCIEWLANRPPR